jgi:acetyltransferase
MNANAKGNLDRLFYPKNIAVVGVSPKAGKRSQGNNYIMGSIVQNFKGKIFPIHPGGENIFGLTTYKSLREVPEDIDLVIFSIPSSAVIQVMEDCIAKKVKFVHFYTAGFSETGIPELADLEKRILQMAISNGIRILGPNCMGVYCPDGGLAFQPQFSTLTGSTSFFSQSGQLSGYFTRFGELAGLRFAKVVSFGNAIDIKASELLAYLAADDKTTAIGAYIEGLPDGRSFFEIAKAMTPNKPLVIYKGGQTDGGARATQSHTASIAGSQQIWESMCRQAGIICVNSLEEMAATISALQRTGLPEGNGVAIVGGAGGGSVTTTDIAEKAGLKVPRLSEDSVRRLKEVIPAAGSSVLNPLDIGMASLSDNVFTTLISVLKEDPVIHGLIFVQSADAIRHILGPKGLEQIASLTAHVKKELGKPIYPVLEVINPGDSAIQGTDFFSRYHENNIATFPSFGMAAKVIKNLYEYKRFLVKRNEEPK